MSDLQQEVKHVLINHSNDVVSVATFQFETLFELRDRPVHIRQENLYVPGLMNGHQNRSGVLRHLGQGLHQTVGRERVQTGRWFVQEQNACG